MPDRARSVKSVLKWGALFIVIAVPFGIAAGSPLLAWREPIYIIAGFAGVAGLALLLVQPLLIAGYLPGVTARARPKVHMWVGGLLVSAVLIHVLGLFITSPPDVIDALLFRSPTSFSVWGVAAMWAVFATALLAAFRGRLRLKASHWRWAHASLAIFIVGATAAHALLIEGTMETVSKVLLCAIVVATLGKVIVDRRIFAPNRRR